MSHLQYFDYEGFGERVRTAAYYSQAVRIGDRIELSGQGGWDRITEKIPADLGEEIDQTFDNINHSLQKAGGKGWEQVYKVRCYCAPLTPELSGKVIANLRKVVPNHQPLLTVVGVPNLALEGMRIEIEVEAHVES